MNRFLKVVLLALSATALTARLLMAAQPIIVDHQCTDITRIPQAAIEQAKAGLHIAYGHTSHGSQLTTGMTGLVGFANGGGLGMTLPADIFAWNHGGTNGALDLHDYFQDGDLGNPDRTTWAQSVSAGDHWTIPFILLALLGVGTFHLAGRKKRPTFKASQLVSQ